MAAIGIAAARPLLLLMDTPENVIEHSVLYMRIYFLGMPVMLMKCNFKGNWRYTKTAILLIDSRCY